MSGVNNHGWTGSRTRQTELDSQQRRIGMGGANRLYSGSMTYPDEGGFDADRVEER